MKAKIYENYVKNGRSDADKDELVRITSLSSDTITKAKDKYLHSLGNKLNDPQTGAKSYWSILNKLLQKIKIPLITPILSNGTFITNVCEKITLFNTIFADQCTPINNSSTLPPFEYKVNSKIEDVSFSEHGILSIHSGADPMVVNIVNFLPIKNIGNLTLPLSLTFQIPFVLCLFGRVAITARRKLDVLLIFPGFPDIKFPDMKSREYYYLGWNLPSS